MNCLTTTDLQLVQPAVDGAAVPDAADAAFPVEFKEQGPTVAVPAEKEGFQVFTRAAEIDPEIWRVAFGNELKDFEYYRLIEETLAGEFEFRYMLLVDQSDQPIALQPLILVDQDLCATAKSAWAGLIRRIRQIWPRFLRTRTLMAGCLVGDGKLGVVSTKERHRAIGLLAKALMDYARSQKIRLIVAKDFPVAARDACNSLIGEGYTQLGGFPSLILRLNFSTFDDYLRTHLSKITRKGLRRKLRKSDNVSPPIELEVLEDCAAVIDEVYPLYLQVTERSEVHFEVFTKDYFLEAGRRMPGRFRYFVWRRAGKAIAFSFCVIWGDTLYDNDIGLDYDVAHELNLYYLTFRDLIEWALARGLKYYRSAPFNYDPKLRLGLELVDLDLYVRHTSRAVNAVLRCVAPYFSPAKSDPVLRNRAIHAKKDGCETVLLNGSLIPGSKLPSAQSLSPSQNFS